MKKFISLLLALVMVLSLSTVALAAVEEYPVNPATDADSVNIPVNFTLVGAGTSPAVTFTLSQTAKQKTDGEGTEVPDLGTITGAAYTTQDGATAEGNEKKIVVNLPTYSSVGVYEYTLTPTTVNLAGVDYRTAAIKLVVTVINDGNGKIRVAAVHTETEEGAQKANGIAASYSAGALNVSKTVDGNLGDKTKYFEFKVTLTGENGKDYAKTFAVTGGSYENNPETATLGENTFYLKHGETVSIANLPYNVTYAVTETAADGYTTTPTGANGTISAATQDASFLNVKNGTVDTGVMLDSLPYILVLAFVAVAGTALILKKRANV